MLLQDFVTSCKRHQDLARSCRILDSCPLTKKYPKNLTRFLQEILNLTRFSTTATNLARNFNLTRNILNLARIYYKILARNMQDLLEILQEKVLFCKSKKICKIVQKLARYSEILQPGFLQESCGFL